MLVAPQFEEFSYRRRVPEQELLHRVLVEHLETFVDRACTEEHTLPSYVEKELRNYVECGVRRVLSDPADAVRTRRSRNQEEHSSTSAGFCDQ